MDDTVVVSQTESEAYKRINDEYLKKQKRNRVITYSILSFLSLALALAIIILACVKIDLIPKFIEEPSSYEFTIDSTDNGAITDSNDEYSEIGDILNSSFRITVLSATFTNSLGGYTINETTDKFYSSDSNGSGSGVSSTLSNYLGDNYLHLYYGVEQYIYSSNGKIYYSQTNTKSNTLAYKDVYIPLSSTNSSDDITIYFGTRLHNTETDTTETSSKARITSITVRANTYSLYDFAN